MNKKQIAGYYCFLALLGVKDYFNDDMSKQKIIDIVEHAIDLYEKAEELEE